MKTLANQKEILLPTLLGRPSVLVLMGKSHPLLIKTAVAAATLTSLEGQCSILYILLYYIKVLLYGVFTLALFVSD